MIRMAGVPSGAPVSNSVCSFELISTTVMPSNPQEVFVDDGCRLAFIAVPYDTPDALNHQILGRSHHFCGHFDRELDATVYGGKLFRRKQYPVGGDVLRHSIELTVRCCHLQGKLHGEAHCGTDLVFCNCGAAAGAHNIHSYPGLDDLAK